MMNVVDFIVQQVTAAKAKADALSNPANKFETEGRTMADNFTPCPRTIRMCLDVLPNPVGGDDRWSQGGRTAIRIVRENITALLPKPDPAKALLDEWHASQSFLVLVDRSHAGFARWLFETGRMK